MERKQAKADRRSLAVQNLLRTGPKGLASEAGSPASSRTSQAPHADFKPAALTLTPLCVKTHVAAQMIGIGKTKLYELIAAGEVETLKMGKSTLVTVASLHALVNRQLDAARG